MTDLEQPSSDSHLGDDQPAAAETSSEVAMTGRMHAGQDEKRRSELAQERRSYRGAAKGDGVNLGELWLAISKVRRILLRLLAKIYGGQTLVSF